MKTTIDIPEDALADVMRFTAAKAKRAAVVTAIADFNRRQYMTDLLKHAGSCGEMMTVEELHEQRRRD